MTQKKCFYCGIEPNQLYRSNDNVFVYNGLDRKDSTKGYEKDNILSCCKQCNISKNKWSLEEFMERVERIYYQHFINHDPEPLYDWKDYSSKEK